MPTRTNQKKSAASPSYPQTTWVKCDLTEEMKLDLKQREISGEVLLQSLAAVIGEGFKVSISFDSRSDCFGAYLTAPAASFANGVHCLSARAPLLEQAVAVLLYKHIEVLREDWAEAPAEGGKRDQWG